MKRTFSANQTFVKTPTFRKTKALDQVLFHEAKLPYSERYETQQDFKKSMTASVNNISAVMVGCNNL